LFCSGICAISIVNLNVACPCLWLQRGLLPVLFASSRRHQDEDLDVFKVQMRERHMVRMDCLHADCRFDCDPEEVA
jgi:diketogulonate reductase-like aldo/keto reductase